MLFIYFILYFFILISLLFVFYISAVFKKCLVKCKPFLFFIFFCYYLSRQRHVILRLLRNANISPKCLLHFFVVYFIFVVSWLVTFTFFVFFSLIFFFTSNLIGNSVGMWLYLVISLKQFFIRLLSFSFFFF